MHCKDGEGGYGEVFDIPVPQWLLLSVIELGVHLGDRKGNIIGYSYEIYSVPCRYLISILYRCRSVDVDSTGSP